MERLNTMMKHKYIYVALVTLASWAGEGAGASVADEYAVAAALGVFRSEDGGIVSIDFDVPRQGPVCITIDEGIKLNITWDEYHNLHQFVDETSFENCDFSTAIAIESVGRPRPDGITFYQMKASEGNGVTNAPNYFACSKICASNGHKMKICRGGKFGERSECDATAECPPDRTVDIRTGPREYVPVGKVCRPKNGDGYSITSGVDTPESCRKKCDDAADRCGAWEFEDHDLDNKECELHEIEVVSYKETIAMGDCEIPNATGNVDYRCCWIAKEIVETQTETDSIVGDEDALSSGSGTSLVFLGRQTNTLFFYSTTTVAAMVVLFFSTSNQL